MRLRCVSDLVSEGTIAAFSVVCQGFVCEGGDGRFLRLLQ